MHAFRNMVVYFAMKNEGYVRLGDGWSAGLLFVIFIG